MKYSFNTWVYGSFPVWLPSYPLEEVIKRLAIIGYDGVEIGCAAPHAWPDFLNKERRAFLKKTLDENNAAYIDGFFTFLISNLLNKYNFIHGIDFYGFFFCDFALFSMIFYGFVWFCIALYGLRVVLYCFQWKRGKGKININIYIYKNK